MSQAQAADPRVGRSAHADPACLDHALAYAALGWPVLPVRPRGKVPQTANGLRDATTDAATIRGWWQRWPSANVGVALKPAGLLAVDVDPRNGGTLEALDDLPATLTAQTGGGGWHLIFRVPPGATVPGSLGPGIDVKHDGYIVAEPSTHDSGGSYRFNDWDVLSEPPPPIATSPARLLRRDDRKPASEAHEGRERLDLRARVREILAGEHWHENLVRLAAHFVATRMREDDVADVLRELFEAARDGTERWRERYEGIARAVRSAVEKFSTGDGDAPARPWPGDGRVDQFLVTAAPALPWFAADRLLANRAALLVGLGGTSKTRALVHLGIAAAVGRLPWAWTISRTGTAALILAEDTADGAHRTLRAMVDALGLSSAERAKLAERLRLYPLAGRDCRLLERDGATLRPSVRAAALLEALRGLPPPLVFVGLDPALALTEGDELDQVHQRRLGEFADRIAIELGACVVLTAHAAKASASADEPASHTARGAGAITDAVRAEFTLRTMTAAEARKFGITDVAERKSHVQLVATKGNELPPAAFAPVWLRRGLGGTLSQIELAEGEGGRIGQREQAALAELRRLCTVAVPTFGEWRDACVSAAIVRGKSAEAADRAMHRIRAALLAAGLVERGMSRGSYVPVE